MIAALLCGAALVSVIAFPWSATVLVTLAGAFFEPLLPLSVGLVADALYHQGGWPYYTLSGGLLTVVAFFVRSRLRAGII